MVPGGLQSVGRIVIKVEETESKNVRRTPSRQLNRMHLELSCQPERNATCAARDLKEEPSSRESPQLTFSRRDGFGGLCQCGRTRPETA